MFSIYIFCFRAAVYHRREKEEWVLAVIKISIFQSPPLRRRHQRLRYMGAKFGSKNCCHKANADGCLWRKRSCCCPRTKSDTWEPYIQSETRQWHADDDDDEIGIDYMTSISEVEGRYLAHDSRAISPNRTHGKFMFADNKGKQYFVTLDDFWMSFFFGIVLVHSKQSTWYFLRKGKSDWILRILVMKSKVFSEFKYHEHFSLAHHDIEVWLKWIAKKTQIVRNHDRMIYCSNFIIKA